MILEKGSFSIFPANMCKGLPAYEQIVFIWLCHHSNAEGICFPSLKTLSYECGLSKDSVIRSVKKLEERGFITKIVRKNDEGENISTLYTIVLSNANSDNLVADSDNPLVANSDNLVADSDTNYINITKPISELNSKEKNISSSNDERSIGSVTFYKEGTKRSKKDIFGNYSPEFEEAFAIYPHHNGVCDEKDKEDTWRKWQKLRKDISESTLLECAKNYAEECFATSKSSEYCYKITNFYGRNAEYKHYFVKKPIKINEANNGQRFNRKQTASEHHAAVCKFLREM
jgi:hypothetical protein